MTYFRPTGQLFLDSEFLDDGKTLELISIALVRDDGREYYAINTEFDWSKATDWLNINVKSQLEPESSGLWKPRAQIASEILEFAGPNPRFWGYFADYDWVILCQLYGPMINAPAGWPHLCFDIAQLIKLKQIVVAKQAGNAHHCLHDARWIRDTYNHLRMLGGHR